MLSKEMEVHMEKGTPCDNHFVMVNPISSSLHLSLWASRSASVLLSGLSTGYCGASALLGGSKRNTEVTEMEYMFSKMLTPSDVGKLNRLLIPRQCAEKYFPKISEAEVDGDAYACLAFEDSSTGLVWSFRYTFWRSSNTYVLTKGWTNFIKVKKLNPDDVVSFYRSVGEPAGTNRMFIHVKPHVGIPAVQRHKRPPMFTSSGLLNDDWVREGLGCGSSHGSEPTWKPLSAVGSEGMTIPEMPMLQPAMVPKYLSPGKSTERAQKRVRLFGVDIDIPPRATTAAGESSNGHTYGAA